MEHQICWNLKVAMDKTFPLYKIDMRWKDTCELIDKLRPKVSVKTITWQKPEEGRIKLNINGSFLENNGKVGIGGIARDTNGNFLFAFVVPIQCRDHNIAEALGAQFATKIVKDKGYEKCTIEMDSKIIVDMIQSNNSHNLKLRAIMEDIICLIDKNDINFIHCFREANKVADYLAKCATIINTTIIYDNFNKVPEGPFFLDKVQMPSFRFKYDKVNFFVS
ncbi:hypothetical protein KY290_024651 [Solanum tuberosum]|uniref:RNase H type-1 domain-containing protein n=1 Tax=Solanum tuberosum TaxID=4113 RepID=A0ABQ7UR93_SOLTU|nr:hypothetical protein KY284_023497 [Solanum tuberosum]KAH0754381.1 hypothetical protein KY290_024651 [Solanum tuberosum]